MAHLRKPEPNNLASIIWSVLDTYVKQNHHVTVALSGGIDSVVLLDLVSSYSKTIPFSLSAIHINHGISRNSGQWYQFCANLCRTLQVPITIVHLSVRKQSGISLEAAARQARYKAFNCLTTDYLVIGQHQDDQAETLFLQLLRGAGLRGLAAMPITRKQQSLNAPKILRPMLEIPRNRIAQYAAEKKLNWINDESNNDFSFDRNFLRHKIFPLLKERYPACSKTFSRVSRHLAESSRLLDELAQQDAKQCMFEGRLQTQYFRQLSIPRAKNLLRYTFAQMQLQQPSSKKMAEMIRQLFTTDTNSKLHILFGNAEIRCYKGSINVLHQKQLPDNNLRLVWQGENQWVIKQLNGSIHFIKKTNYGLDPSKFNNDPVTIRMRTGGERFRPDCMRPRRKLKTLFQEASIPAWERNNIPLLYCGEQLVWIPGIGVACEFQVKPGKTGLLPTWKPDKPNN